MKRDKWYIQQVISGQRKRAAAAVLLGADVVVTEIKKRTKVDTGNLKGNNQKRKINDLHWQVYNNTSYAPDVEFGTPPHEIRIKTKKVLTDGKTFFGKVVQHPGTKAQPFMRPGYRAAKKKVKRITARI